MKQNQSAYKIPDETANALMMLYTDTRSIVRSPDGYRDFFEITSGVFQGDTLALYLFNICLDYVLSTALESNTDLGFTFHMARSRRYSDIKSLMRNMQMIWLLYQTILQMPQNYCTT